MSKISVIMPVYNAERFLNKAIDSILQQTFTDFEFLIIDDCSTDKSADIIKSYEDNRIRYYRNNENLGISATLNKGINLANSEWIARMDADDISYPNRFSSQYNFIEEYGDGALYSCDVNVVDEDENFIKHDNFKSRFYYYNQTFICWIYHPSVIFRKSAVIDVGMYTVPYAEDFELFWQLTRKYKHYHQEEILIAYRVNNQSLHQVLKKDEYALAQRDQILRNVRHYTGVEYNLPLEYIEALQHNFQPLLKKKSVKYIVSFFYCLDYINACILKTENINRNVAADREAADYKRKYIIDYFVKNLPIPKALSFLFHLKKYRTILKLAVNRLKRF